MKADTQRKTNAILQCLAAGGDRALGATAIAADLERRGISLRQRMVRNYLDQLDALGLTENLGRRGRRLTPKGRREVDVSLVVEKVGFVSAKADELAYAMSFDLQHRAGSIILNISRFRARRFADVQDVVKRVLDAGLGLGRYVSVGMPGSVMGGYRVPDDAVALGTVCSFTLNGVLRLAGIPTLSRFGGLLELRHGEPRRFVHTINYDGTTIDPVEIFIKGRLTHVLEAADTGNGAIGASFREIPASALPAAEKLLAKLAPAGLGGVQLLGRPGHPLLDIPVSPGRCGLIVSAGLNPLAAVDEYGIETVNLAMACLFGFADLTPVEEFVRLETPEYSESRGSGPRGTPDIDLNRLRSPE